MVKKPNNEAIQKLVRVYLNKLEHMLARMVDEDRIFRDEIHRILGKSYSQCIDNDLFDSIGRLKSKCSYSKIDVMILKEKYNG